MICLVAPLRRCELCLSVEYWTNPVLSLYRYTCISIANTGRSISFYTTQPTDLIHIWFLRREPYSLQQCRVSFTQKGETKKPWRWRKRKAEEEGTAGCPPPSPPLTREASACRRDGHFCDVFLLPARTSFKEITRLISYGCYCCCGWCFGGAVAVFVFCCCFLLLRSFVKNAALCCYTSTFCVVETLTLFWSCCHYCVQLFLLGYLLFSVAVSARLSIVCCCRFCLIIYCLLLLFLLDYLWFAVAVTAWLSIVYICCFCLIIYCLLLLFLLEYLLFAVAVSAWLSSIFCCCFLILVVAVFF